jgi:hypothetical protein
MKRPWYARPAEAVKRRLGLMPTPGPVPVFETRAPSVQTAVDLFKGQWASDLSEVLPGVEAGRHRLFTDHRPRLAAEALGTNGRLDGMSVLELGPLEGAHSWQLAGLGAAVVGVEANATAFLKCLVVKEALSMERVRFLLGDFSEHLRQGAGRYDMVFASGVLYHMADPLDLIALIAASTDRCFVWTQHYAAARCSDRVPEAVSRGGFEATYWRKDYGDKGLQFWGSDAHVPSWMEAEAILAAFRHFGMTEVEVLEREPDHEQGPAFTIAARRP